MVSGFRSGDRLRRGTGFWINVLTSCTACALLVGCDETPISSHSAAVRPSPTNNEVSSALPVRRGCVLKGTANLGVLHDAEAGELWHVFDVVNDTAGKVSFEPLRSSCGCSAAALDRLELEPGEKAALRVRLSIDSGTSIDRSITTSLPTSTGVTWDYQLNYALYPEARFTEHYCLFDLRSSPPSPLERDTAVVFYGRDPRSLPNVEDLVFDVSAPEMTAHPLEFEDSNDDRGVATRTVRVRLCLTPFRDNDGSGQISVRRQSMPQGTAATLPVAWRTRSVFQFHPTRILFRLKQTEDRIQIASPQEKTLVLRASGSESPFGLIDVGCSLPAIGVSCRSGSSRTHVVRVSIDPQKVDCSQNGEVFFRTDSTLANIPPVPISILVE